LLELSFTENIIRMIAQGSADGGVTAKKHDSVCITVSMRLPVPTLIALVILHKLLLLYIRPVLR
jgi:hypothetical protein